MIIERGAFLSSKSEGFSLAFARWCFSAPRLLFLVVLQGLCRPHKQGSATTAKRQIMCCPSVLSIFGRFPRQASPPPNHPTPTPPSPSTLDGQRSRPRGGRAVTRTPQSTSASKALVDSFSTWGSCAIVGLPFPLPPSSPTTPRPPNPCPAGRTPAPLSPLCGWPPFFMEVQQGDLIVGLRSSRAGNLVEPRNFLPRRPLGQTGPHAPVSPHPATLPTPRPWWLGGGRAVLGAPTPRSGHHGGRGGRHAVR